MARIAKNLKELVKLIQGDIKSALNKEVANMALDKLNEHVVTDVYNAYTSKAKNPYERTNQLLDDMEAKPIGDDAILVRSTREEDGRDIAYVIETGKGYTWEGSEIYRTEQERPFHKLTAEDIEKNGLHIKAMKKGLKRSGINVK